MEKDRHRSMTYPFAEIVLDGGAEKYAFENGFDGEKTVASACKGERLCWRE